MTQYDDSHLLNSTPPILKPITNEKTLSAAQIRRGAFTNSGSRDAGVDKDWDFKTGRYNNSSGDNVKPITKSRFDDALSPFSSDSQPKASKSGKDDA